MNSITQFKERIRAWWKSGYDEVMSLAWPAIGEMFLYTVVWVVDTGMVGRLGPEAVAAVGWAGQTHWVVSSLFMGLAVGTTSLVARSVGAHKVGAARTYSWLSMLLAVAAGALVALGFFLAAPFLFSITGLPVGVTRPGVVYLRIVGLADMVAIPLWAASAALRGYGDTRTPLMGSIFLNIINIALDYLLIFGHLGLPALGVTGAALANALGTLTATFIVIWTLWRRRLSNSRSPWRWLTGRHLRNLVFLGIPSGLENVSIDGARALAGFLVAGLGTLTFAAQQLTTAAESLSFMPGFGFAVATSVVAGQYVGARDPGTARARVRQGVHLALMFMGALGLCFVAFPRAFVSLFTTDPALLELAARSLRVAGATQVFVGITEIYSGALRGAGDTRNPMIITAFGAWFVRIPLTYLFAVVFHASLPVVWLALTADWMIRAFLTSRVYSRSPRFIPAGAERVAKEVGVRVDTIAESIEE